MIVAFQSGLRIAAFLRRLFICLVLLSFLSADVLAGDFASSVAEGQAFGSQIGRSYAPDVLDSTLQSKGVGMVDSILPKGNDPSQTREQYTTFYTNPGGIGSAASGEALDFVRGSYETRTKYDLAEDPVFGSTCLERDSEGRCAAWSLSKDLVTSVYPDCTKVLIPQYETSELVTCTSEASVEVTPECRVRNYLATTVESVAGPCSGVSIDVQPDQIYAVCRDNIDLYRVNMGEVQNPFGVDYADVRPEMCAVIGGCDCWGPFGNCPQGAYTVNGEAELPAGAMYYTQGIDNVWVTGGSGDRIGHGTWYRYYWVVQPSTLERLFLRTDRTCSESDLNRWTQECTIKDYAVCDSSYTSCTYIVYDSVETGAAPSTQCADYPSAIQGYEAPYCGERCLPSCWPVPGPEYHECLAGYSCDEESYNWCVQAFCYEGFPECLDSCRDMHCTPCSEDAQCSASCLAEHCTQECDYNSITCSSYCGNIPMNNYNLCTLSAFSGMTLNGAMLSASPQSQSFSTTGTYGQTLSWQSLFGGPGAGKDINNWHTKLNFVCESKQDSCASLREQGCVLYESRCLDMECTRREHTYRCGKDRVTGYTVAYNCAGQIRCIGTECGADASYQANTDFAQAAAVGEVLNMARVDSSKAGGNIIIFPGKEMECEISPKNCCRPNTARLSIADYVKAAQAAYSIYKYASGGMSAVATSYAQNITWIANSLASKLGIVEAAATYAEAGGVATTTATITTEAGTTTINTTFAGADMVSSATVYTPSATISMVGTVASAVGLVLTAYSVVSMVYDMTFACTQDDLDTSIKLGYNLCHFVDTRSTKRWLFFTQRWRRYCCFNSILAKIVHEQGRPQIGLTWGGGNSPLDCRGLTAEELASIDFSRIDFSEYLQYVTHHTAPSEADMYRITENLKHRLTGH